MEECPLTLCLVKEKVKARNMIYLYRENLSRLRENSKWPTKILIEHNNATHCTFSKTAYDNIERSDWSTRRLHYHSEWPDGNLTKFSQEKRTDLYVGSNNPMWQYRLRGQPSRKQFCRERPKSHGRQSQIWLATYLCGKEAQQHPELR